MPSPLIVVSRRARLRSLGPVPFGTKVIAGVEVIGLGPIGVSIMGFLPAQLTDRSEWRATGSDTGALPSSATNWQGGIQSYRVQLHCTKNEALGWGGSA